MTLVDLILLPCRKESARTEIIEINRNGRSHQRQESMTNSMEVSFPKFRTFLAKMYQIEKLTYEN